MNLPIDFHRQQPTPALTIKPSLLKMFGLKDAAVGRTDEATAIRCLNKAKLDSVKIMRVDKLNFTDLVKRCCVNRE